MVRAPFRRRRFTILPFFLRVALIVVGGVLPMACSCGAVVATGIASDDTLIVVADALPADDFSFGGVVRTTVELDGVGGMDLADLLASSVGIQIRRYGGLGAEVLPSIRGCSAAQVVVMIDGVPVTDARDGVVNLAALPLARFVRAEISRGFVPAAGGGIGGAGAINLITRKADRDDVELSLSVGSFGDAGGRFLVGGVSADGRRRGLVHVHGRRLDNHFPFLNHNQTFVNQADDFEDRRRSACFEEYGLGLSGQIQKTHLHASATAGMYRRDGGRPGPLGFESPDARRREMRLESHVLIETPGRGLRLDLSGGRIVELLHDDEGQVGWDPPGTTRGEKDDFGGRLTCRRQLQLPDDGHVRGQFRIVTGVGWRRQIYAESLNQRHEPLRKRTTVTTFASLQLDLFSPRLSVVPGWRWQRSTDDFPPVVMLGHPETPLAEAHLMDAVSTDLSLSWEAVADCFWLEWHGARTARQPTWTELFGYRGGIDGNRELRPEEISTMDLGGQFRLPGTDYRLRAVCFTNETRDAVVFIANSQHTSKAFNIGRTHAVGCEVELAGTLPGGGVMRSNLTWQDASDRSGLSAYDGKQLPWLSPVEIYVDLQLPFGAWQVGAGVIYESASYRDRYNWEEARAPARTVCNLHLRRETAWSPIPGFDCLTTTAEVFNVADNDVYDVEGFPLPGRTFSLSLSLSLSTSTSMNRSSK